MGLKTAFFVIMILVLAACKPVVVEEPAGDVACDPNDRLCIPPSLEDPDTTPIIPVDSETETPEKPALPPILEPELPEAPKVPSVPPDGEVGLPRVLVTEGGLVSLADIRASDPDQDALVYLYSEPLDADGEWQTKDGDAGEYLVTITATDGKAKVSQQVLVIVKSLNNAPILSGVSDAVVDEGQTVSFNPVVTDDDGDDVTIRYSGWMQTPSKTTTFDDAGTYFVTITATDGKTETSKQLKVTIRNVNRPPVLAEVQDIKVTEGALVKVTPLAVDQDGDALTYTFEDPLDEDGRWQTEIGDAGTYLVNIAASDSVARDVKSVRIVVNPLNKAPIIQPIADILVNVGETVSIFPQVSDPDGDQVTVTISGWMTTNTYITKDEDGGEHTVKVTASDGKESSTANVRVTVNRPPKFLF
ncbi:MAG: hypothetical protein ABIH34_05150 [Nanoarchaeota archaeon]